MRFLLNGCTKLCCLFSVSAGLTLAISRAGADEASGPDENARPEQAAKNPAQAKKVATKAEESPADDEPAADPPAGKPEKGKPAQEKGVEKADSEAADTEKTPPPNPTGVTFSKDIAPILWKNCAACHRPGEIGPFPLLTYKDASKRADFLAEVTASHRMPPWKPEPNYGHFADERRLSDTEVKKIADWAKAGAPEGDKADLPKPPKFSKGWQHGEPDLVLKMPEKFSLPADGPDVHRCFVIPIPIEKDAMVSGAEFRPGNPSVVHHAIMFLDATSSARKKDEEDETPGFESFGGPGITPTGGLGGWAPGAMPRFLPEGIVKYVKKGSDLVLQIHYHPNGKPTTDQSQVGVYFSKKPAKKIVTGVALVQPKLEVPADEARAEVTVETKPLPTDVQVIGISPHMHNLGKEMKVFASQPGDDEKEVPLIWIKDWDFNWQGQYLFKEPVHLPKGSIIKAHAIYDNSEKNPKNPNNPPKTVQWGEQTTDEMLLCGVQVITEKPADLRLIAAMPGNELGSGLDGGIPGQYLTNRQTALKKASTKAPAADGERPADAAAARNKKNDPFPEGGVEIPEENKKMLSRFDTDEDGKLTRKEVAKMPSAMQSFVLKNLLKQGGGGRRGKR
ncbi:MAG TPA: hypothetical protein VL175_09465 [Pirellulales bacterium]|jgi:mono/diheme cytochrome c family protein|nr:hypothetical protein [Pirellulales bacterium]